MVNINIELAGVALPIVGAKDLREITTPNESNNVTLGGTMYTDYVGWRRSWEITWPRLQISEYDSIRSIYENQFITESYPLLEIPFYNIEVFAKLSLSIKDIIFDGDCVRDFSIRLDEQVAIS